MQADCIVFTYVSYLLAPILYWQAYRLVNHNHSHIVSTSLNNLNGKGKGKAVLLQAWSGPDGSRELRFPDFMTTAQDGVKVVSLTHRPPLPHRKYTWYSFLLEAESTPGP